MAAKPGEVVTFNEEAGHVTNQLSYIFTTTMIMATKLGRVVQYKEELPAIKSQNLFITWSCNITQQMEYFISPLL